MCCLAGAASLIDDIRADLRAEGISTAIRRHDTATLFDWLISALSYQGISDQVASEYMERHGRPRWADIDAKVAASPTCPKLASYWHFHGCRYDKISRTCSEPDHIDGCPLPSRQLRNGRLNQMAYSFFLFNRDIADGDLIGWIDRQFEGAKSGVLSWSSNYPKRCRTTCAKPLPTPFGFTATGSLSHLRVAPTLGFRTLKISLSGICDLVAAYKNEPLPLAVHDELWTLIKEMKLKAELAIDPSYATGARVLDALVQKRRAAFDRRTADVSRATLAPDDKPD